MTDILIDDENRIVKATYEGGTYIELYIGHLDEPPDEVINVYDYELGMPEIEDNEEDVRVAVFSWMEQSDEDWPKWYEGYIANA